MRELVSIVMPVKNAESHLKETLLSILDQTYKKWELIAVDDHSEDASLQILNSFAQLDDRIIVLKNQGAGIIDALTQAIQKARGEYVSRMDADDLMPETKLETLLRIVKPNVVATGRVKYFGEEEISEGYLRYERWINGVADEQTYRTDLYRECVVASPNWLISREFFDEFDFSKWKYPEDYDLIFHWFQAGYDIIASKEITHLWREHPERTSRNSDVYQQRSFFELKTNWFIERELTDKKISLIGNNVKSKLVIEVLNNHRITYDQYDLTSTDDIKSVEEIEGDNTTILTNWPLDQSKQNEIREFLESKGLIFGQNLWLF